MSEKRAEAGMYRVVRARTGVSRIRVAMFYMLSFASSLACCSPPRQIVGDSSSAWIPVTRWEIHVVVCTSDFSLAWHQQETER